MSPEPTQTYSDPRLATRSFLVELPALPIRPLILKRLLPHRFRLLFSSLEHALLTASDALVCVQSLKNEFRRRDLPLRSILLGNAKRSKLVDQSLNPAEILQRFGRSHRIGQLNLSTEIKPLHNLLHIRSGVVLVVGLGNRSPNQLAPHVIRTLHLAFVLQFELSRDCRERSVDIADPRHHKLLLVADGAPFGVR